VKDAKTASYVRLSIASLTKEITLSSITDQSYGLFDITPIRCDYDYFYFDDDDDDDIAGIGLLRLFAEQERNRVEWDVAKVVTN
jgi:hypothetical protein